MDHPIEIGRSRKNSLGDSKEEKGDVFGMLGDDPDPMVMTARVGFGEVSDEHARGLSTEQRD